MLGVMRANKIACMKMSTSPWKQSCLSQDHLNICVGSWFVLCLASRFCGEYWQDLGRSSRVRFWPHALFRKMGLGEASSSIVSDCAHAEVSASYGRPCQSMSGQES